VFIGIAMAGLLHGQDYHFSQFMPNLIYVNPACAAMPETGEIGLTYRNQWPGIPATFVTYGASVIIPVKNLSSGIGVNFINDVQAGGVINRTLAGIDYGYLFDISRYWQIGAGLSASWVMKKFNSDALVFRSDLLNELGYGYDPVVFENYSRSYPDFSVGFIARNDDNLTFGISASHVTRPRDGWSSEVDSRLPLKYNVFISGRLFAGERLMTSSISLDPAIMYSYQHNNSELLWGTLFNIASNFQAGAWVRQNLNFNFESLILSLGLSYEKYNINYSYDVNLKKIKFLSTKMAAHEVTFLYRFEYKDKKYRKVKCPAY
jgi:type IX secretion system PorP/SprF family membrane protein